MTIANPKSPNSVDYHSLGTRHDLYYSGLEKAQLFANALDEIENIISDTSRSNSPTSVPELVRQIFDDNNRDPRLETIREAIRPTSRLSLHSISATGQKLLALLATLQDSRCLDDKGNLRLEYTKSMIRGWFHNADQVSLDDSALRNIHQSSTDNKIRLGQNRLKELVINTTGKLTNSLDANLKRSGFGEHALTLDFTQRPQCAKPPEFHEVALGDMNGNSVMFLHQLVQTGLADIKPGQEDNWDDLIHDIENGTVAGFREKLDQILELKNKDKKLVLLGDLLSDRTYNDWFTLSILDYLHTAGQNFSVCFSNHDAAFVEFYLANKDKDDQDSYVSGTEANLQHTVSPNNSLIALKNQLNGHRSFRQQFRDMTENYLSHLVLMDSSLDQKTIYAHGILTAEMLRDMLRTTGLDDQQINDIALQERIHLANNYFRAQALGSLDSFQALMKIPEEGDLSDQNPFHAAIWSTGPFSDNRIFLNHNHHPYLDPMPPMDIGHVVHGHTADIRKKTGQKAVLSQLLKTAQVAADPTDAQQRLKNDWDFMRKALQAGGSVSLIAATLAKVAHEHITQSNTAFEPSASVRLRALLEIAKNYPRSDIDFLNAYPASANDELAMHIANYKAIKSNNPNLMYTKLTSDPLIGKNVKSLLQSEIQKARLVVQQRMLDELEILNTELGYSDSLQSCMENDHTQAEMLHTMGNKLGTFMSSYQQARTSGAAASPFDEILANELGSIWSTDHDDLAATRYVSLDSGVGASEDDTGGEVRIFMA